MEEIHRKGRILSISIGAAHATYLDEHPTLRPSHIMQRAIDDIMERSKDFKVERDEAMKKIQVLAERYKKAIDFLEAKQLDNEFLDSLRVNI